VDFPWTSANVLVTPPHTETRLDRDGSRRRLWRYTEKDISHFPDEVIGCQNLPRKTAPESSTVCGLALGGVPFIGTAHNMFRSPDLID
jgi:hypothetical protein